MQERRLQTKRRKLRLLERKLRLKNRICLKEDISTQGRIILRHSVHYSFRRNRPPAITQMPG